MHLLNGFEHFDEQLDCNFETIIIFENFSDFGEVHAQKVHDDKVLLRILDEVINIANVFQALEAQQDIVLENENAFVLIFLFHLESHIFLGVVVIRLIDEAESALTKFLLNVESIRDFQGIFVGHHSLRNLALLQRL
jgi:hypothetical protein